MLSPAVLGVLVRKHCKSPFHAGCKGLVVGMVWVVNRSVEVRTILSSKAIATRCVNANVPLVGESFAFALLFKTNVDPANVLYASVPVFANGLPDTTKSYVTAVFARAFGSKIGVVVEYACVSVHTIVTSVPAVMVVMALPLASLFPGVTVKIVPVPVTANVVGDDVVESPNTVPPAELDRQYWASVPVNWSALNTFVANVATIVWEFVVNVDAVVNVRVSCVGRMCSFRLLVPSCTVGTPVVWYANVPIGENTVSLLAGSW